MIKTQLKSNSQIETNRKRTGSHYTPTLLANFVAKKILTANKTLPTSIRVLDPAIGDGELLLSLLNQLSTCQYTSIDVVGFDTNASALQIAKERTSTQFPFAKLALHEQDFLEYASKCRTPDLFNTATTESVDLIIANPPYVRTQVLGTDYSQQLAKEFGLSGRVDLYHAFILAMAWVLKPNGIAGIIVSNRFMTTKSGKNLRKSILEQFNILHIWDMGDTKLFDASVLPCVLILERKSEKSSRKTSKFSSIYSTNQNQETALQTIDITSALHHSGIINVAGQRFEVKHGRLKYEQEPSDVWRIATDESEKWLSKVQEKTYFTFGDVGKIRVGVKTTADKVFIRNDWNTLPKERVPELLMPLATHHIARRFRATESSHKILYTHKIQSGKRVAVDLKEFPRAAKYLNSHRTQLEKRDYVLKSGRNWYEVWVPQDPTLWEKPKVIFRDIAKTPVFWLDTDKTVVNGDCYWMVNQYPKVDDFLWLILAVGNSTFIEDFYDHRFHNKLYSGRRRFVTQYVEKFPLPDPSLEISQNIVQLSKQIYDSVPKSDTQVAEEQLDKLVWQAFGVSQKSY